MSTRFTATITLDTPEPPPMTDTPTIDELVWLAEQGQVSVTFEDTDPVRHEPTPLPPSN